MTPTLSNFEFGSNGHNVRQYLHTTSKIFRIMTGGAAYIFLGGWKFLNFHKLGDYNELKSLEKNQKSVNPPTIMGRRV